jgi:two-component system, LytTR family, sensor kinase
MSAEVLPEVRGGQELEQRLRTASTPVDQGRWADELLACLLYCDPQRASRELEPGHTQTPCSEGARWRARGILAAREGDYPRAHYAFSEADHAAGQSADLTAQLDILLDRAGLAMNRNQWAEAESRLAEAARLLKRTPSPRHTFRLGIRQAWLALLTHQMPQALSGFMQAERVFVTLGQTLSWEDVDCLTLLHSGLGDLYTRSGERELARRHFYRVVTLCRHYGVVARIAWHLLHAGNASMAQDRWDEAADAFRQAIAAGTPDQEGAVAAAWANLGYVAMQTRDLATAREALDKAEVSYRRNGEDRHNLATVSNWKARLAMLIGQHREVMPHFVQATDHARAVKDNTLLAHICKDISAYFAAQEDHRNAYEYLLLYDELGERAREEAQQRKLMEIQVQYETEKMEKETESLRAQAVELRLQAMRAQMNPHFLFNALNGIQNFIHSEDPDKASRYLAKFAGLVRKSLNLSNTELITLEEEVAFIRDYLFVNQKLRFEGRLEFEILVDEEIDEDRVVIPPMMIQPFVENAIEHGFIRREKGMVRIRIDLVNEELLCCTIEDDGIGREAAIAIRSGEPHRENHQSLGIGITCERLELLNRSGHPGHRVEITDLKDKAGKALGTKVELFFPVRRKGV